MAHPAYMWIKDEEGNLIKSNSRVEGREYSVEVLSFKHQVYIPSDRDTGILTGTRKHEAFVIGKYFCSASPILYKVCCSGKTLQEIKLCWYRINTSGIEEEYFRHVLKQVKIVAVKPIVKDIKDKANEFYGHFEEIHFRYQEIEWVYLDGNIIANDQWAQRM